MFLQTLNLPEIALKLGKKNMQCINLINCLQEKNYKNNAAIQLFFHWYITLNLSLLEYVQMRFSPPKILRKKLMRSHVCFISTKSVECLLVKGGRLDMLFIWPHTRHIRFTDMESFWTGGGADKPFTPLSKCTSCKTHLIPSNFV